MEDSTNTAVQTLLTTSEREFTTISDFIGQTFTDIYRNVIMSDRPCIFHFILNEYVEVKPIKLPSTFKRLPSWCLRICLWFHLAKHAKFYFQFFLIQERVDMAIQFDCSEAEMFAVLSSVYGNTSCCISLISPLYAELVEILSHGRHKPTKSNNENTVINDYTT